MFVHEFWRKADSLTWTCPLCRFSLFYRHKDRSSRGLKRTPGEETKFQVTGCNRAIFRTSARQKDCSFPFIWSQLESTDRSSLWAERLLPFLPNQTMSRGLSGALSCELSCLERQTITWFCLFFMGQKPIPMICCNIEALSCLGLFSHTIFFWWGFCC